MKKIKLIWEVKIIETNTTTKKNTENSIKAVNSLS